MPRSMITAALMLGLALPAAAQTPQDEQRFQQAQQRFQNELSLFQQEFDRYQRARASRPAYDPRYDDPRYDNRYEDGYDAAQYYRPGQSERVLGADDRVYRGSDGRYYCRRTDGTTGLIVGGAVGGIFGNAIAPRGSRTLGSILGIVGGAALGNSIDRNRVSCR